MRPSAQLTFSALLVTIAAVAGLAVNELSPAIVARLADESDVIVTGKVLEVDQPGDGTTHVRLRVAKILKGVTFDKTLLIVVPGGRLEGSQVPVYVRGQPRFEKKEKDILFLHEVRDHYEICEGEGGKWFGMGQTAIALETQIKNYLRKKPLR